jgi:serine/threonine protein phosphatase PrpC
VKNPTHAYFSCPFDNSWSTLPFQSTELKDYSGTTATVSLIFDDILWVINVGDSRTVLSKGNVSIQLSEEAKATVEKYAREIYWRGGDISNGRVINFIGSSLDMARSIGDIDHPSVSAMPTIKRFDLKTLENNKSYLILGCDGLWDVISPQMATEICQKSHDINDAALKLEKAAFLCGTADNVTVMVVDLSYQ